MADSNIVLSGLAANGAVAQVVLNWSVTDPNSPKGLPYLQLDAVEVWASQTDDRSTAIKIGEGVNSFTHAGLHSGAIWYYWIKPRNKSALYGNWYPLSATSGVQGIEGNGDFEFEVGADHFSSRGFYRTQNGPILQAGQAISDAAGLATISFLAAFPTRLGAVSVTMQSYSGSVPVIANIIRQNASEFQIQAFRLDTSPPTPAASAAFDWDAWGF